MNAVSLVYKSRTLMVRYLNVMIIFFFIRELSRNPSRANESLFLTAGTPSFQDKYIFYLMTRNYNSLNDPGHARKIEYRI